MAVYNALHLHAGCAQSTLHMQCTLRVHLEVHCYLTVYTVSAQYTAGRNNSVHSVQKQKQGAHAVYVVSPRTGALCTYIVRCEWAYQSMVNVRCTI